MNLIRDVITIAKKKRFDQKIKINKKHVNV